MNEETPKPRSHRSLRRWLNRRQDDFFFLAGFGFILGGTWREFPHAFWFVTGGMCLAWGVVLAMGARR